MNVPYKRINITLPKTTDEKLEQIAKKEGRSKSNMISFLIDKYKD